MIIQDRLRSRATHLDLRAHFLQSRSKRFNLLLLFCYDRSLFFHLAVLFEKFVEQHRVHRFIAHGVRLALVVPSHQIGIDLSDIRGRCIE